MENFFVKRPIFAISLAIAITLLGLISIFGLSIEQFPSITPPVVEVSAMYDGADAETVNNSVAVPVGESVMGVNDMLYMQSTSANDGTMSLQVTFDIKSDPNLDAIFTQNDASTATAKLPSSVVEQGVVTKQTETGFLMVYSIHSDGRYDDEFIANYSYINIQNQLLKINGVGKVMIMGPGEYAMRVWIKPDLLSYYNVSLDEVRAAILAEGGLYPAGQFGAEPAPMGTTYTYTVTLPPQISTAEEFGRIAVKTTTGGEQILLSQIADISLGSKTYGVKSFYEGQPSSMIIVYQEPGSNAVDIGKKIRAEMAQIEQRLPDGIEVTTITDATQNIETGIKDIFTTLIIALILVIFVIYLFIQDWRAVVVPLVAIPVSLIGAFMLFPLLGFSINIISLLGLVLAIGLVVDDAIVVVEAAQVNIEQGMNSRDAAAEAMRSVSSPIIATTVVLLAVFIPVSFVSGITGLLFRQFSITIAVSVVISAINALSLSPALCSLLLRPKKKAERGPFGWFNRWFDRRMEGYTASIRAFVKHIARTAIIVGVLMVGIVLSWKFLPKGFLPEEDQGYLMVMVNSPEASSIQVTEKNMMRVNDIVRTLPEVESTSFGVGFNMLAGINSTYSGIMFVRLVDFSERKLTSLELSQMLNKELYAKVPSAKCFAFIPPSIPGLGVTSGITCEVLDLEGRGTAYLSQNTDKFIAALRTSPKISAVTTEFNAGVPQRRIDIDRDYALREGVSLQELYSELNTLMGGTYVNNFNRFGQLYQTYIAASPEYRLDEKAFDSYYISNGDGESVPLSTFVTVRDTVGMEYVSQFNLYRSIELNIAPGAKTSSSDAMAEVESIAAKTLPKDIDTEWSGISYQESAASSSGGVVYLLALIFVFLALAALYNSWGLPFSILLSVPAALLGALVFVLCAHFIDPLYINNIYMEISMVLLIGLAAKNSILVVEYANRIFYEKRVPLLDAVVEAARLRARPIIMTAFAFIFGVLPLALASGLYSTSRNIMGVALVGGMLLATIIGIFIYPALYYMIAKIARFEKKRDEAQIQKPQQQ